MISNFMIHFFGRWVVTAAHCANVNGVNPWANARRNVHWDRCTTVAVAVRVSADRRWRRRRLSNVSRPTGRTAAASGGNSTCARRAFAITEDPPALKQPALCPVTILYSFRSLYDYYFSFLKNKSLRAVIIVISCYLGWCTICRNKIWYVLWYMIKDKNVYISN